MDDWTGIGDPDRWYRAVASVVSRLEAQVRTIPEGITVHLGSLDSSYDLSEDHERPSRLVDSLRAALSAAPGDVPAEVTEALDDLVRYLDELARETGTVRTTLLRAELATLAGEVRRSIAEHSSSGLAPAE